MCSSITSEKAQVTMMVRYELKKIFGSFGGKIALILYALVVVLSCWLATTGALNIGTEWINEQGEQETGLSAIHKMQEAQNEWEGYLDQETLTKVVQENARINGTPEGQSKNAQKSDIALGWKQGFDPIRELINRSYAAGFRSYDYYTADAVSVISAETFYANRIKQVKNWLNDKNDVGYSLYSEKEKEYIIGQYEALETPFYFDYHDGWYQLLENLGFIPMLGILILGFVMAGIFSNEFKWKADAVYFSTLHGRTKATATKIKAGLLLVTVIYWIAMLIYSFFTLGYLGFEGAGCVVQLRVWKSLYNITMWQAWILAMFCGYIGNLFLAALTMYISAKTKSAVIAVTTPFVIMFIPSFLQGMADWLDVVVNLMPVSLLEFYQHLGTFNLITVFGKVYRTVDLCIPLYILLTILLIPIMYREYKIKQVL